MLHIRQGATICLFLAGCSSITGINSNYPDGWPSPQEPAVGCPNIVGNFANRGSSYSYSQLGGSHYLAYRFGMSIKTLRELDSIDTIRIHPINDDEIIVDAIKSGEVVNSRRLSFATK